MDHSRELHIQTTQWRFRVRNLPSWQYFCLANTQPYDGTIYAFQSDRFGHFNDEFMRDIFVQNLNPGDLIIKIELNTKATQ